MSPEQVRGDVALDGRSDIYSLGIILYEMLVGHQPYQATTPMSAAMRHLTDPIPQICLERPELPAALQAVLERALAKDRDQRYARATDLAFDLRALVDSHSSAPLPSGIQPAATVTQMDPRPGPAAPPQAPGAKPGTRAAGVTPEVPASGHTRASAPLRWIGVVGGIIALAILVFMGIRLFISPDPTPTPPAARLTEQAAVATQPADEITQPAGEPTNSGFETSSPATESTQAVVQDTQSVGEPASSPTETAQPTVTQTNTAVETEQPAAGPTATADAYPPPAASPTLPAEPTPAFADDFSVPANGWAQERRVDGGYSYQDGTYIISVRENGALFWAAPEASFADLRIQVQSQRISGDQGYYGVLCRLQDSGDFYYFVIRPDG